MLWRFAPMADEYVAEWHSRDLDATILEREVAAVQEWKKTNYTFHIMRDNPGVNLTNILQEAFAPISSQTNIVSTESCEKYFCTKKLLVKCW